MRTRLSRRQAVLYGTLAVGTLDALDAIVFFGLRSGAHPVRIFQGIASGLLGRASCQGGLKTSSPPPPVLVNGLPIHRFGVGQTSVLFARAAAR